MQQGGDLLGALQCAVKALTGIYALAVMSQAEPERLCLRSDGVPVIDWYRGW